MPYQRIFDARYDTVSHTEYDPHPKDWQAAHGGRQSVTARQIARVARWLLDFIIFLALFFGLLTACGFVLSQLDHPSAVPPAATLIGPSGRAPFTPTVTQPDGAQQSAKRQNPNDPLSEVTQ